MTFRSLALTDLIIDDEPSFAHVGLYAPLKAALLASGRRFLVLPEDSGRDRALFLNLTFWGADGGSEVLAEPAITADEVSHMALHHVVHRALGGKATALVSFFAESIASAFDLYLVGRLLRNRPESDFIESQVPIMAEAAEDAGMDEDAFEALLLEVVEAPEQAFEELRQLLFDTCRDLAACTTPEGAQGVLSRRSGHRFAPLLHHYQLSNWLLHTRAYALADEATDQAVLAADAQLRAAPDAIEWLATRFVSAERSRSASSLLEPVTGEARVPERRATNQGTS